jgi:hypothetical protein
MTPKNWKPPPKSSAPSDWSSRGRSKEVKEKIRSGRRSVQGKFADENAGWQEIIKIRYLAEIARQLKRIADQRDAQLWSTS